MFLIKNLLLDPTNVFCTSDGFENVVPLKDRSPAMTKYTTRAIHTSHKTIKGIIEFVSLNVQWWDIMYNTYTCISNLKKHSLFNSNIKNNGDIKNNDSLQTVIPTEGSLVGTKFFLSN